MFRWVAIMAAVVLATGSAFAQSSSDQPVQPVMPLGSGQMMGHQMMNQMGPMMMDQSMMPMMNVMGTGMMGPGMMSSVMMSSGMMGPDMMGCRAQMGMKGMQGAAASYTEARLAFVKSELAIDQAQEAAWEKYAAALRDQAKPMSQRMSHMQQAMATDLDFPARFDARVNMLEDQLQSLKAVRDAAVGLYGQLSPEQKRKADTLLPMSLCM